MERANLLLPGPNWNYRVTVEDGEKYRVNVFNPKQDEHRTLIQGRWHGAKLGTYKVEDVDAASPEEALIQALIRVLDLEGGK